LNPGVNRVKKKKRILARFPPYPNKKTKKSGRKKKKNERLENKLEFLGKAGRWGGSPGPPAPHLLFFLLRRVFFFFWGPGARAPQKKTEPAGFFFQEPRAKSVIPLSPPQGTDDPALGPNFFFFFFLSPPGNQRVCWGGVMRGSGLGLVASPRAKGEGQNNPQRGPPYSPGFGQWAGHGGACLPTFFNGSRPQSPEKGRKRNVFGFPTPRRDKTEAGIFLEVPPPPFSQTNLPRNSFRSPEKPWDAPPQGPPLTLFGGIGPQLKKISEPPASRARKKTTFPPGGKFCQSVGSLSVGCFAG